MGVIVQGQLYLYIRIHEKKEKTKEWFQIFYCICIAFMNSSKLLSLINETNLNQNTKIKIVNYPNLVHTVKKKIVKRSTN